MVEVVGWLVGWRKKAEEEEREREKEERLSEVEQSQVVNQPNAMKEKKQSNPPPSCPLKTPTPIQGRTLRGSRACVAWENADATEESTIGAS